MNANDFTQEQLDVLAKVEKLMRLAAKNPNQNEAAAASAKAAELLAAYNLEAAELDIDGEASGKRAEEALLGGFYQFERDLWRAISELNFIWYFTKTKYIPFEERKLHRNRRITHQHVLIGKVVNIAGTKAMAGYLMQTIERLTKEQLKEFNEHPRGSFAVSFRRGVAERVIEKINRRRWEQLEAEEKRVQEAAQRAREAGVSNVETGLTLATVEQRETEANYDFKFGKGAYAQRRKEMIEAQQLRAEARARAEAEYTAWAAAHPEEAAKQEAQRVAEERRRYSRRTGRTYQAPAFKGDWHAYSIGRKAGNDVGIDPQTSGPRAPKGHLR